MSDAPRQCYICLEEEGADDREWVAPCRCSGTLKWVHQTCIIRWVREHERSRPFSVPACPQCRTKLRLMPEKGAFVSALEFIDTAVYPALKFMVGWFFGVFAFDGACTTFGIFVESQVYGFDQTLASLKAPTKIETMMRLHLTSIFLVFINSIRWEHKLLVGLRKLSRFPSVKWLFPQEVPNRYRYPLEGKPFSRVVVGSALLPFCGRVIGNYCFSSVDSQMERVFLGGITYLGVKGVLTMYLLQKQEVRRKKMVILPCPSVQTESSEGSSRPE